MTLKRQSRVLRGLNAWLCEESRRRPKLSLAMRELRWRIGIPVTKCPCAVRLNASVVLGFLRRMSPVCERAWAQKAPM